MNKPLIPNKSLISGSSSSPVPISTQAQTKPQVQSQPQPQVQAQANKNKRKITYQDVEYPMPLEKTIMTAVELSILNDKPIMLDYWIDSLTNKAFLGVHKSDHEPDVDNKKKLEKNLVKSHDEYTSTIIKGLDVEKTDIICETENSIYIVSRNIKMKNTEKMVSM